MDLSTTRMSLQLTSFRYRSSPYKKVMAMTVLSFLWKLKGFKFLCGAFLICILLIQIHYKLIISVICFFQIFGLEFWASRICTFTQNIRQLCCLVKFEIKAIKNMNWSKRITTRKIQDSHSFAAFSCTISDKSLTFAWVPCVQFYIQ